MKKQELFFYESIKEAIRTAMLEDEGVICFGLGTTDPKGIFGTTQGLEKEFGNLRVLILRIRKLSYRSCNWTRISDSNQFYHTKGWILLCSRWIK